VSKYKKSGMQGDLPKKKKIPLLTVQEEKTIISPPKMEPKSRAKSSHGTSKNFIKMNMQTNGFSRKYTEANLT